MAALEGVLVGLRDPSVTPGARRPRPGQPRRRPTRRLDVRPRVGPGAHRALRRYRGVYRLVTPIARSLGATVLLAFATSRVGVHLWVWPALAALGASLWLLHRRPARFRLVAAIAGLTVLAQLSSAPVTGVH